MFSSSLKRKHTDPGSEIEFIERKRCRIESQNKIQQILDYLPSYNAGFEQKTWVTNLPLNCASNINPQVSNVDFNNTRGTKTSKYKSSSQVNLGHVSTLSTRHVTIHLLNGGKLKLNIETCRADGMLLILQVKEAMLDRIALSQYHHHNIQIQLMFQSRLLIDSDVVPNYASLYEIKSFLN